MGYTTEFQGGFRVTPLLDRDHALYLRAFSRTRRMRRDAKIASLLPDPIRKGVRLDVGPEGSYYVGSPGDGDMGQTHDASIIDYNSPPGGLNSPPPWAQPGLWCQWIPGDDDFEVWDPDLLDSPCSIVWSRAEKFYDYDEWLEYLIKHFLEPWGHTLNGKAIWRGENFADSGILTVEDNVVSVRDFI